jgi:tetratricopeptide (TPR) repeat protein
MYQEVLAGRQLILGPRHPDTIWTRSCLGGILFTKEKSMNSVQLVEGAFADLESVLGPAHLDTLWLAHNLAMVYENLNRVEEAQRLQKRAMEGYLAAVGPDHIDTLWMINDLGVCYSRANKFQEAEQMFRLAFEGKIKCYGPRSPHTLFTATLLASAMKDLGNENDAEVLLMETLNAIIETVGNEHSDVCNCMMAIADIYVRQNRFEEAKALYEKVYKIRMKQQGPKHNNTRVAEELISEMQQYLENPAERNNVVPRRRNAKVVPIFFAFRTRTRRDERRLA